MNHFLCTRIILVKYKYFLEITIVVWTLKLKVTNCIVTVFRIKNMNRAHFWGLGSIIAMLEVAMHLWIRFYTKPKWTLRPIFDTNIIKTVKAVLL